MPHKHVMNTIQAKSEVTDNDSQQEREMKEAFRRVSGDDMEIDAYELQEIMNAAFMKGSLNLLDMVLSISFDCVE